MTIHQTIARPYAKAIFEEALSHSRLQEWYKILFVLAKVVENKTLAVTIGNPSFSAHQTFEYVSSTFDKVLPNLTKSLKTSVNNLVRLLLQYKHLTILPNILKVYQRLYYRYKKISVIRIASAFSLSESQKKRLGIVLKKYFNTAVEIHYNLDRSLIGGLLIQSENLLIDSSIKNQLKRLKNQLIQT